MALAKRKPGLVCTFYSYKGGVGRSMALANVAVLLSRLGQKVLVIDWDLEAPGLEQYFGPQYRGMRRSTPGLVEFIASYGSKGSLDWRECLLKAFIPKGEPVDIIHAGRDDPEYSNRLRSINWDRLFEQGFGRYLENIRSEWKQEYDYIFVDSRTGITDIGGICSILLPDYLLSLFTTTEQSVLGVKDTMTRARAAQSNLPLDRQRLIIIPIAARDESTTEYKRAAEWRKRFAQELSGFYEDWISKDETAESVLDYLKIPYIAYWSFGEQLPVLAEDASNPKTLAYSYTLIARLIHSRLNWSEVREGRETTELQAQRAAEVQTRLAEAAKVRTEALSQQQVESAKILEERKAALVKRFDYLVEEQQKKRKYGFAGLAACVVALLITVTAAVFLNFAPDDNKYLYVNYGKLMLGLVVLGAVVLGAAAWCYDYIVRHLQAYDALKREFAAYTIARGVYAELGTETSLRLFGDRIERIAEGIEPGEPAPIAPGPSAPSASSVSVAATTSGSTVASTSPHDVTLAPAPSITRPPPPSINRPPPPMIEVPPSIDVLLSYSRQGISRDWALEFIPLFSRWLSEMLGRSVVVYDASANFLLTGDILESFQKAASAARTAVLIVSGRTQEMEGTPDFKLLLDRFSSGRLFPVRLSPRRSGPDSPLDRLQFADFSDLAYVGEGFAKSERYIEFQDRVRALARQVADAIEQEETLTSPPPPAQL
jgi:cellulose biosynthesis protein BcsQ